LSFCVELYFASGLVYVLTMIKKLLTYLVSFIAVILRTEAYRSLCF